MSIADTYIGNADGLSITPTGDITIPSTPHTAAITETWATYALDNDTKFAYAFFIWNSLSRVRFATALIGFIGYVYFIRTVRIFHSHCTYISFAL